MKNKLSYLYNNIEEILCSVLFGVMSLMVLLQLVFRVVFNSPLFFTEEICRFAYLWVVFLSMAMCEKRNLHFAVDVYSSSLKTKVKVLLDIIINVVSILLFGYLLYYSYQFVLFNHVIVSPALEVTMSIVTISMVVGFALCILRKVEMLKNNVVLFTRSQDEQGDN